MALPMPTDSEEHNCKEVSKEEYDMEYDVISLMERRLPRYVVNCFRAAGYDEIQVVASMDTSDREMNSISIIEKYIEGKFKHNPDMLPPTMSLGAHPTPFEFPPGHRIRICNFVKEVKQLLSSSLHYTSASLKQPQEQPRPTKKLKLLPHSVEKAPHTSSEVSCQIHMSIATWVKQQKLNCLNTLQEGKHYFVVVKNDGNDQVSAFVKCCICHTSVRLQQLNQHYQLSNWTRHIKRCASNATIDSKQTKLLLPKTSSSAAKLPTPTIQPVSVDDVISEPPQSSSNVSTIDDNSTNQKNLQVFRQAPPLLQKEGQN